MRSFRLDRILKVEPRPAAFARPAGFDALGYLTQSMAAMPRAHPVEIVLHTDLKTASAHFFGAFGVLEQVDGGVLLRCSTDHVDWFAGHLASLPFGFEVRGPDLLRASVAKLGERLLRMAGTLR
jgi:predicted DNA-binding transcriptional regulator YafY